MSKATKRRKEKLAANSVICENAENLGLLLEDNYKGKSGDFVFKRVKASIAFNEIDARMSSAMGNLAMREAAVMSDARWAGSKSGEAANHQSQENKAKAELTRLKKFQEGCILTSEENDVTVLETKAISGLVKVKAMVKGTTAEVWTRSEFLVSKKGI